MVETNVGFKLPTILMQIAVVADAIPKQITDTIPKLIIDRILLRMRDAMKL